jgi:hypothetical protein
MADDLGGKSMTMIKGDGAHLISMPHELMNCFFEQLI